MSVSDRLSEAMRAAGIGSQRELSRLSGVSQSTIHRLLKQEYPSAQAMAVFRIAEACKVSVDWLLGGVTASRCNIEHSARELELIKNFRRISPAQRELIEISIKSALTLQRKV